MIDVRKHPWLIGLVIVLSLVAVACGGGGQPASKQPAGTGEELAGTIDIDGSSTVFPITQAAAEEFQLDHPGVDVPVGISGTGGGFKKFCNGETDISDASRPIKDSEKEACASKGIEWVDFTVAFDGLSVMVNPANEFVECLTTEELHKIWQPNSTVKTWADVRPEWPAEPIVLYGPDADSGTFDYFTEEINGEDGATRTDYTPSADDNVLVQGIAGDRDALGYFGYAYYVENTDKLKLVAIDSGNGCVLPTPETIENGEYTPLSRPLFIYVRKDSLKRPEVQAFVEFYLSDAGMRLVPEVGYVNISQEAIEEQRAKLADAIGK
ncbi:MAG: PstS family phosphate ABC transporter substrate-binding protein [Caldilineae bacterium]|nr:MAG: PstS family phosphate ABC transporter substrate-binding protein [Caldilineae bacterium]